MKNNQDVKEGIFIILITVIVFGGLMLWSKLTPIDYRETYWIEENDEFSSYEYTLAEDFSDEEDYEYPEEKIVTVTKYNPVVGQCDADPLITADGSFIDTLKLKNGDLKWIAISRDLRSDFNYGDTVIIYSDCGEIDGEYVVHDTMNARWKSRIDILSPKGDSRGKWENVSICKK